ncbi:MAG: AsnC family transcriptional regulator [Gammaproteobacteria bacterium]|nr:AsnC family transcriptional regulator [Gammaproteobacteria bacterium]
MTERTEIDAIDRQIIAATQGGLPLSRHPYHDIAEQLGLDVQQVLQRMQLMLDKGIIRRIGVIPNHYKLGYKSNGMSVWNIPDEKISAAGMKVGSLDFVSHCYQRPRFLPAWPYNLFAMVHGKTHDEVIAQVEQIARLLGEDNRGHEILFSTRILKKTGLRIG